MADMVVSAATGALSSLLSKLSELLTDQYKQRKGVRRDIEFLCRELTDMNAALEKLAGTEKLDVQTKVWRDKVREIAYDIEDCVDIFMHQLGQEDNDKQDGLFHKIVGKVRELRLHYQLANKIQELRARVEEQSQNRDKYKIDESIPEFRMVEVDPRLPALFVDANKLVGIDGPREEITKLLMEEGDNDARAGQLKVLSIVGFGGLGKTTLANQILTKLKIEFDCTALVPVSRAPDMSKILKKILSRVGFGNTDMEDDVQKLIEILRSWLMNKRYLIIIDDLWSTKDWSTIECAFVDSNNYSRVITTTRIQDIATACCFASQGHVYQMRPLNELHSRRLFIKRLFDTEDGCPEQFKAISNDMLRKCKGVPLAITSIASLLANQSMHVETWEKIRNSLGSELDTNPTLEWMRHVLSLSYNDLSHQHKTCLLYLGMYPEDSEIPKNNLVRKWIAEGFITGKHGLDLEEVGENYLNELINRSMIQPCFNDRGEVWWRRVHDLMLDLIISKCKEENFIAVIDRRSTMNEVSQIRRISHQFNNIDMALEVERMSPSKVRSYNSIPTADCMPPLSKFELLRVLDMDHGSCVTPKSMHLNLSAINHLFLLRYLRVSGFHLKLPNKFGKLKHLMTIDLFWATLYPSKQSSDFTSLSSLRHLTLPFHGERVALRNGLRKLCNLRTLFYCDIGTNSAECIRDLGELTNLRELCLFYSRPGDVKDNIDTILAASLDKLGNSNMDHLIFEVRSGARPPSTQFWSNCFKHPRHLQRLFLDVLIPKVPSWMAHAHRLAYLYRLRVQELRSNDIKVLAQLPSLIYLDLEAKTIPEKNIKIDPNTFPSLKNFQFFCELSCLTFEADAMPQLQRMKIRLDARLQGAMQMQVGSPVCGIKHLASLEKIEIYVYLHANCSHKNKIYSACGDAITSHPKSRDMQICVKCVDADETMHKLVGAD